MKTSSCKAKGRKLQNWIHALLHKLFPILEEDDIAPRPMGSTGEDIILSPAAQKLVFVSTEAKNQETLSIWSAIKQAEANATKRIPVVVFARNGVKTPYAVLKAESLYRMVEMIASEYPYSDISHFLMEYDPFPYPIKKKDL